MTCTHPGDDSSGVIVAAHFPHRPLLMKVALSSKDKGSPQNKQRSFPAFVNVRKSSSPVVSPPGVLRGGIINRLVYKTPERQHGMRGNAVPHKFGCRLQQNTDP